MQSEYSNTVNWIIRIIIGRYVYSQASRSKFILIILGIYIVLCEKDVMQTSRRV